MEGVCNKGTHAASMHAGEGEFVMGTWVRGSTPSVASFPLSISQASRKEMVMPDFMDTRWQRAYLISLAREQLW